MKREKNAFLNARATELRNESSATERLLWSRIRNRQVRGYRFRRRTVVHGKIPDFSCPEASLVIEIDGFPSSAKRQRDKARDAFLAKNAIRIVHLPSDLIWKDLDEAVRRINECLPSAPSKTGLRQPPTRTTDHREDR